LHWLAAEMCALRRFVITSLGVLVLVFVVGAFRAPSNFDWRHAPMATWLTGLGIALGCGLFVALVELLGNLFAPKRGRFGRREQSSIWDHISIP
jgi:hypothetical protein